MFEKIFGRSKGSTLLEAAFDDLDEMLSQSEKMLEHSVASLLENRPLEVDLEEMDDTVDTDERMLRRSVLEHLVINPKQDLVASLVLVSIAYDAERIGDFARGLSKLSPLARSPREGDYADRLRACVDRLRPLFGSCREAFRADDPAGATKMIRVAERLKEDLFSYRDDVAASELTADMAVVYSGAALILHRIAAHLVNIASSVIQPYDRIRHLDENA